MRELQSLLKGWALFLVLWSIGVVLHVFNLPFFLDGASSFYYLAVGVYLIYHYASIIVQRNQMRILLLSVFGMTLLMFTLRGLRYQSFSRTPYIATYLWYGYYIPIIWIPALSYLASLCIGRGNESPLPRRWYGLIVGAALLSILVLTNNYHQQVFVFLAGNSNLDYKYTYGWGYYAVEIWQAILLIMTLLVMCRKSKIVGSVHLSWLMVLQVLVGYANIILIIEGKRILIGGRPLGGFPEAFCFIMIVFWDTAMRIGFIPTNTYYSRLMEMVSVGVQITDRSLKTVYKSKSAAVLTIEEKQREGKSALDSNTILYRMKVSGGYGFWQQDLTSLNEINRALEEMNHRLLDEVELRRLENENREKQKKIETRSSLYDSIALFVQPQAQKVASLAEECRLNMEKYDHNIAYICFLGAYIKRAANLMLLAEEQGMVSLAELQLSLAESLRYLNEVGIPGRVQDRVDRKLPGNVILEIYRVIEEILENRIEELKGVYIKITTDNEWTVKVVLEGCTAVVLPGMEQIRGQCIQEDEVCYIRLTKKEAEA